MVELGLPSWFQRLEDDRAREEASWQTIGWHCREETAGNEISRRGEIRRRRIEPFRIWCGSQAETGPNVTNCTSTGRHPSMRIGSVLTWHLKLCVSAMVPSGLLKRDRVEGCC